MLASRLPSLNTSLVLVAVVFSTLSCFAVVMGLNEEHPVQALDWLTLSGPFMKRADPGLAGYLGAFFLGSDPFVYFYLSNGNNPTSFKALNKGSPILRPTKGTGGVRDPALVQGGGAEAGRKWYIVGTDLDIGKTNWGASQRTGSRGIFVWESNDLINWVSERLAIVEDETAGMVWAPEAIWDPEKEKYLVYWASKFYPISDTRHTGSPSNTQIRYSHTSDFKTFTAPQAFINKPPSDTIDLTILPLRNDGKAFLRFMKDESKKDVFAEVSETGLFGTWTRPGGGSAIIQSSVEGPAAYLDNQIEGKVHLLLDFYGGDGYRPYESTSPQSNSGWTASDRKSFPANLRHGSVMPINQTLYSALAAKWGT